jgi:hypothetical protein
MNSVPPHRTIRADQGDHGADTVRTVRLIPASRVGMMPIKRVLVRAPKAISALHAAISLKHAITGIRAKKSLAL